MEHDRATQHASAGYAFLNQQREVTDTASGNAPGVYIPLPVPEVLDASNFMPSVWLPSVLPVTLVNVFVGVLYTSKAP